MLIIEDDVDWDIHLKTQIKLLSTAVHSFTSVPPRDPTPYGRNWDILWLGHCGEYIELDLPHLFYADPTAVPRDTYLGWASESVLRIPDRRRAIAYGYNPVCTFAYAVTRQSAPKVLQFASSGADEAFDIKLMNRCWSGELVCVTVNPELMHSYNSLEGAGYVSEVDALNGVERENIGDVAGQKVDEMTMGRVRNIFDSARCRVLFNSTSREVEERIVADTTE